MSKYQVKVGEEFELVVSGELEGKVIRIFVGEKSTESIAQSATHAAVPVVAQAAQPSETAQKEKSSIFADWKNTSVVAVAVLILTSGAYAAASGNYAIFNSIVEATAKVATEAMEKK